MRRFFRVRFFSPLAVAQEGFSAAAKEKSMKRILVSLLALCLLAAAAFAFTACGEGGNEQGENEGGGETPSESNVELDVYMPDGAPALSMAQLMSEEKSFTLTEGEGTTKYTLRYNVVDASTIQAYVGGEDPAAAIAVFLFTDGFDVYLRDVCGADISIDWDAPDTGGMTPAQKVRSDTQATLTELAVLLNHQNQYPLTDAQRTELDEIAAELTEGLAYLDIRHRWRRLRSPALTSINP